MIKICLDANIFIDEHNHSMRWHNDIKKIFALAKSGVIEIYVSLQTLEELSKKKDDAYKLAQAVTKLPHWPVGSWDEQVGTWDDAKESDNVQLRLAELAKSGNDIRDRGAFLDALKSKIDYFVTSDGQLVNAGPDQRINAIFDTKVIKPEDLIKKITL